MRVTLTRQIRPNNRIAGIKAIRSATGLGLRESKEIADAVGGCDPMRGQVEPVARTIAIRPEALAELRCEYELIESRVSEARDALVAAAKTGDDFLLTLAIDALLAAVAAEN